MSRSPRFAAFLKEHNLCGLLSENDDERWVYREDLPTVPFMKDKDGLVYVNLAYKGEERRLKTTKRVSKEE